MTDPDPRRSRAALRARVEACIQQFDTGEVFWLRPPGFQEAISLLRDLLPLLEEREGWQPIDTAPRDSTHVLVFYPREPDRQQVMEAWWAIPYEAAPPEKGWWQTMGGTLLSADLHDGLGATHWMPLPSPPEPSQWRDAETLVTRLRAGKEQLRQERRALSLPEKIAEIVKLQRIYVQIVQTRRPLTWLEKPWNL